MLCYVLHTSGGAANPAFWKRSFHSLHVLENSISVTQPLQTITVSAGQMSGVTICGAGAAEPADQVAQQGWLVLQ
jgi:hypothetical protein